MKRKLNQVKHVHFITPYSYSLEIGEEYNAAIKVLPANAWVCINDQDTLKPPGFAERVKYVIEYEIGEPDSMLVGCKTNRMSKANTNVVQHLHEEENISVHLSYADSLWADKKTALVENDVVAGYCMIFNKQLWEKVGGFPRASIRFDSWLSERANTFTAEGLYIFHLYRWWNRKAPEKRYRHLLRAGSLCGDPYVGVQPGSNRFM